jgi:hypothetical protein
VPFDSRLYIIDPETGDLKPRNRKTLGQYLSKATSMSADLGSTTGGPDDYTYSPPKPNAFPVSPNSSLTQGSTIIDPASNGQSTFVADQDELKAFAGGRTLLDTNGAERIDQHRALHDVNKRVSNPVTAEADRRISATLKRNRFTTDRPATPRGGDPSPALSLVDNRQLSSDVYTQGEPNEPIMREGEAESLYEQMRKEGITSVLRAAGIDVDSVDKVDQVNSDKAFLNFDTAVATEKFDNGMLRASRARNNSRLAFDIDDAEELGEVLDPKNNKTYGQMNTNLSPFSGPFPAAMIFNAVIFAIAATIAGGVISAIFGLLFRSTGRFTMATNSMEATDVFIAALGESPVPIPGVDKLIAKLEYENVVGKLGSSRMPPGNFGGEVLEFITRVLEANPPYGEDNNLGPVIDAINAVKDAASPQNESGYFKNFLRGMGAIIGIDGALDVKDLGRAALTLAMSPGYYVVLMRNIVRNLETFLPENNFSNGGITGGIEGVISYIAAIRDSKLFKFVDTVSSIGLAEDYRGRLAMTITRRAMDPTSGVTVPGNERVSKSKAFVNKRTLAWSFRQANNQSLYLLPENIILAKKAEAVRDITSDFNKTQIQTRLNRLSAEDVAARESELDAEYMPFTFQDLRTNEILNFHAFISELTDSYTPNYNQVDAYGRMDPVMIYKNTTRSISLGFMVVATNPSDFDAMWFTINKLTSLVYPEWSKGTELVNRSANDSETRFIQPFSQVPTSSPMIRLRIGDLIRSNYSKFNIARIFGHWEETALKNKKLTALRQELQRLDEEKRAAQDKLGLSTDENYDDLLVASMEADGAFTAKATEIEKVIFPDNSVTKSFESTSGKGLAGFITSLSYTWYDENTTWEITPGSKAPMMCKVTMQFSPVHDIPMGLDHNGFMRSYPYPVGKVIGSLLATSGSK